MREPAKPALSYFAKSGGCVRCLRPDGAHEPHDAPLIDDLGRRRVRLAALSVARGNGKSAVLAGLSLAHLLGPMMEPYGECYAAALDREQAGVLYRMTKAYIEATPWMAAAVNIKDCTRRSCTRNRNRSGAR